MPFLTMNPSIYIPVIAALAGAFVGALIKELGTFYQVRREDKRVLKNVLFNQLDIWREVRRLYFGPLLAATIKQVSESFSSLGPPFNQVPSQIDQIRPLVVGFLRDVKLGEPERLQQRYQDSVNELSKVDPVLAFRLSRRAEVKHSLAKIDAYLERAFASLMAEESEPEFARKLNERLSADIEEATIVRTLRLLQEDIWRVSRRISIVTCFRALWTIQKVKTSTLEQDPDDQRLLDQYVNHVSELVRDKTAKSPDPVSGTDDK